jgi:heme exporter protein A
VRTFSRGMQQRLAIARALLPDPAVMLMDEPYTGLDPQAAAMLDALLQSMAAGGRAILLTTHDLPRALTVAHRVAILAAGTIVYTAPTQGLQPNALAGTYASYTS